MKKPWYLVDLPSHLTDADVSYHRHGFLDLVQILSSAARGYSSPLLSLCRQKKTSESRCWCWKVIVLVWINACGCLKAAVSAGEVTIMGCWGWWQKEPSCTAVTQIYAGLQCSCHQQLAGPESPCTLEASPVLILWCIEVWEFLFTYEKQSWKEKGKLKAASVSATCQSGPTHSYNLLHFSWLLPLISQCSLQGSSFLMLLHGIAVCRGGFGQTL